MRAVRRIMAMATRSLARRLLLASLLAAALMLLVAGMLLFWMFRTTLERQFDARLEALLNGLLANVEQGEDGGLRLSRDLGDPLFRLPASGWYWQITPLDGRAEWTLASRSLLEKRFDVRFFDSLPRWDDGGLHLTMPGPHGKTVRVLEQRLALFGDANRYSIIIAGDADHINREVATFTRVMALVFAIMGLGLVLTIFIQVRFGLRPLQVLHDEIADVRDGRRKQLTDDFPDEIRSVVRELNQLIRANREVVERARTQVGNLAHALKTPLAVLINEAMTRNDDLARLVVEQAAHMREQVELYLDRARRAALVGTLGVTTPVEETLRPILNALQRIYRDRKVSVEVDCQPGLLFRGERQDLEEMLGNLLDNAFKYGHGHVRVRCFLQDRNLVIAVEDNGPGLTEEQRERAMQRGQRLDESGPGSGLGLSIIKELAAMYKGEMGLSVSDLGGLKVEIRLPGVHGGVNASKE